MFSSVGVVSSKYEKESSTPKISETPSQAEQRRMLAVSSIQAVALDYDVGDHDMLKESVLLEVGWV